MLTTNMPACGPTVRQVQYTGAAAVNINYNPGVPFKLLEVRVHLSAAGGASENLVVKSDDVSGSAYDTVYLTENMNTVADLVDSLDTPSYFKEGDGLLITYTNTNTRTYGITITVEDI